MKKMMQFPMVISALGVIIAAWWAVFMIADIKNDVVRVGKLPDGYQLNKRENTDGEITCFYKNKGDGHITLLYLPGTDISLKEYLESQGVYAKYTTIIPSTQDLWCMYIYSKDGENVGVADTSEGLFIVSSNIGSDELGEVIRSINIIKR